MSDINYYRRRGYLIDTVGEVTFDEDFTQGIKWHNHQHLYANAEHALDRIEEGDELVLLKDHEEVAEHKLEMQAYGIALRIKNRKDKIEEKAQDFREKKGRSPFEGGKTYFDKLRRAESAKKKELEKILEIIEQETGVDLDEIE
jgi:rubrerythrin